MLNMNSPTVQAMLNNTPQGFGNIPVYYGNSPSVTTTYQIAPQQQSAIPFPSPKEMISSIGQQTVYDTGNNYMPRNIVGAYNPGYQIAFNGYSNPYMGVGSYGGYVNPYMYYPQDPETRDTLETAINNGLTYEEQINSESNLYKNISRIVSKNLSRSEEEAKICEDAFNPYNKYQRPNNDIESKPIKSVHIQLKIGDEVVADINNDNSYNVQNYRINSMYVEQMKIRQEMEINARINRANQMYNQAPERMFDNYDLIDFFNIGAGVIMADMLNKELYMQNIGRTSQVYDKEQFRRRLFENNGIRSKDQISAIERFTGRYGVMPNGNPVSPWHDPEIASSFSYNAKTGQYDVVAPNFIQNRIDRAREAFIKSI